MCLFIYILICFFFLLIAVIEYEIKSSPSSSVATKVNILNANDEIVGDNDKLTGSISISNPRLWWPYSEDLKHPGYQYTLQVSRLNIEFLCMKHYSHAVFFSILG